jgi:LPXTG-motif cell wall-anchored protein
MSGTHDHDSGAPHKAGAFDIRVFIASLIGIYGVVLIIAGIIGPSEAELAKTGGVNINLYAGLGMAVVAALFLLWARLRPVVVPTEQPADADDGRPAAH